jgi:serine protease
VVAVTATRNDGAKADYASFGPLVALAAPGGSGYVGSDSGLLTTLDTGRQGPTGATYGELTGTSFAAPLAASVAGMMWAVNPNLNLSDVERLLRQAVRPHAHSAVLGSCQNGLFSQGVCNCTTSTCGSGLLDADQALQLASRASASPNPPPSANDTSSNGGGGYSGWWGALLWAWLLVLGLAPRLRRITRCTLAKF